MTMPDSQQYPLKISMIKYELCINILVNLEKRRYLPQYWSDKCDNGCESGIDLFAWKVNRN